MPQSLVNILAHFVFSTAEREPFLRDPCLRQELHRYLGGVINNKDGQALCVGGVADHVHILLVIPKNMTVPDLVRDIKRASSLWIKERDQSMKRFAWQGGYGAFSVGQTETDVVQTYIESQEEHHRTRTFQEEFLAFLHKYKIPHPYQEPYVWE